MRALLCLTFTVLSWSPPPASAQSYLERKDAEAIGVIERSLAKVDKVPALFDGTRIASGADLVKVRGLLDGLTQHLEAARRSFVALSPSGTSRPDAQRLRVRFDDLTRYREALSVAYQQAATTKAHADRARTANAAVTAEAGRKACGGFRDELDPMDRTRVQWLANLAAGQELFWQTAEDGAKYKETITRVAALCAKPEYANIQVSCQHASSVTPKEGSYCAAVAQGGALMKRAALNLAAFHAKHTGPMRTAEKLESVQGWVEVEGPVTWKGYFSGASLRELLRKRFAPVFAQAGLDNLDDAEVFKKLAAQYAALEAKVTELAPTWDLPGKACSGVACGAARRTIAAWYPRAKLRRLQHSRPSWKIVKNGLGIITHRSKSGHALISVPGEPFCQLRSWTVTESYAGAGRYQTARGAAIGYVRWQTCN